MMTPKEEHKHKPDAKEIILALALALLKGATDYRHLEDRKDGAR